MENLKKKHWNEVSNMLANLLKQKKKYTGKACRERWEGLQAGTNLKPIELDSDQEGRKVLREIRIAEAKRRRMEAATRVEAAKEAIEERAMQKKAQKQERQLALVEEREARLADKAETRRLQAEKKQGRDEQRAALKEAAALWKSGIERTRTVRELEERVYRSITGKQLRRIRRTSGWDNGDADSNGYQSDLDDDWEGFSDNDDADGEDEGETKVPDLHSGRDEDQSPQSDDSNDEQLNLAKANAKKNSKGQVTKDIRDNPRIIMTEAELEVLLFERGLPRRSIRETHAALVARLAAADNKLSSDELSELLSKHFDRGKGSKAAKARRLQEYDALDSAAGQRKSVGTSGGLVPDQNGEMPRLRHRRIA